MRAVAPFDETEEVEPPTPDDINKTFRTRFISIWLLMNGILALVIGRITSIQSGYFITILWITFGLAAVRLLGFLWYLSGETRELNRV